MRQGDADVPRSQLAAGEAVSEKEHVSRTADIEKLKRSSRTIAHVAMDCCLFLFICLFICFFYLSLYLSLSFPSLNDSTLPWRV